jgi:hypothetical protein
MCAKILLTIGLLQSIPITWIGWTHADWINLSVAETAPNIAELTVLNDRTDLKLIEPRMRKDGGSPYVDLINPMTRRPVPQEPKDKRVFFTELDYRFVGAGKANSGNRINQVEELR